MAKRPGVTASPSSTSTLSCITVATPQDTPAITPSPTSASPPGSTPPTSLGDAASVASEAPKMEPPVETSEVNTPAKQVPDDPMDVDQTPKEMPQEDDTGRRSLRRRSEKVPTYNVQILAGTAIHTPTKYLEKHHKNVYREGLPLPEPRPKSARKSLSVEADKGPPGEGVQDAAEEQLATEVAEAAQRRTSARLEPQHSRLDLRRETLLKQVATAGAAIAQKGQEVLATGKDRLQRSLRSGTPNKPAKGTPTPAQKSPAKRSRLSTTEQPEESSDEEEDESEEEREYLQPKVKKWEEQGLYVGQSRTFDARLTESQNRKRAAQLKESKILPLPMFAGERLLSGDPKKEWRDFKMPFDTFSPLPRKVKVDDWQKLSRNRLIGEATLGNKKDRQQDGSKCECTPEFGCDESCHNRSMLYECDSSNCNLTPEQCGNRPFADLKKRSKGNRYDYGVEVMQTDDRGFGVRAMRTFEPHQVIVEYAGEIITQEECDRRMRQDYKKAKCYYLMSFTNKTIIDATRGSIARFVNHSCEPNCEMIKWTVGGEPRMALFAGSRRIYTGEELTYDYNFDPFSLKNIQECKCGTRSCRGVLGPKPKDQGKEKKSLMASIAAGTKRKLQELVGTRGAKSLTSTPNKRRKIGAFANIALTKATNALAEATASKARFDKKEAEAAAQKMSREERALRRKSATSLVTASEKIEKVEEVRKTSRKSLPASFSSRSTTDEQQIDSARKPGKLRQVNKNAGLTSSLKRQESIGKDKSRTSSKKDSNQTPSKKEKSNGVRKSLGTPSKPLASPDIAITAQSLRSSSSNSKLRQTKLSFEPVTSNGLNGLNGSSLGRRVYDISSPEADDTDVDATYGAPAAKRARTLKRSSSSKKMGSASSTTAGVKRSFGRRSIGEIVDGSNGSKSSKGSRVSVPQYAARRIGAASHSKGTREDVSNGARRSRSSSTSGRTGVSARETHLANGGSAGRNKKARTSYLASSINDLLADGMDDE